MVGSLLVLLAACSPEPKAAPAAASVVPAAPAASAGATSPTPAAPAAGGVLAGLCEASTLVPWEGGWLVGDNEDKRSLHLYGPDFAPRGALPLAAEVDDIEAIAWKDGAYLVVGSHSTNKDGEPRPARERIVASDGRALTVALDACPACLAAKGRKPDAGGFNIEGAAWHGGTLWLGLRAPLAPSGAALLLALDDAGRVTKTVEVDLGGQGIREMIPSGDGLLLVSGAVADGNAPHGLWRLSAPGAAPTRLADLPPSTEGIAVDPADPTGLYYLTDGDGKPGKPCKAPATWGRVTIGG